LNNLETLKKEEFNKILDDYKLPSYFDYDFCFSVYEITSGFVSEVVNEKGPYVINGINQLDLLNYTVGEMVYAITSGHKFDKENTKVLNGFANVIADKYLSLFLFEHNERKIVNKYLPPASTIDVYINFMHKVVNSYTKNDPKNTLIADLLNKSLSICRCILNLLINGYETEAFSTWRTLHECECILILLERYGNKAIDAYLRHMNYGILFNKEEAKIDERKTMAYNEIKADMAKLNLKAKDFKKYIEYGWLYSIDEFRVSENKFKLNFRDGLQKLSGLTNYVERYELSSEIIHSTPLLIYSRKEYFYYLALISLYESFFRLEAVFVSLLSRRVSPDMMKQYKEMRNLYYSQLQEIHKREYQTFKNLSAKKEEEK